VATTGPVATSEATNPRARLRDRWRAPIQGEQAMMSATAVGGHAAGGGRGRVDPARSLGRFAPDHLPAARDGLLLDLRGRVSDTNNLLQIVRQVSVFGSWPSG
jgi:hypothetical protein